MKSKAWEMMGTVVTVHRVLYSSYEEVLDKVIKRWWTPEEIEPRAGWITGVRSVYEGEIDRAPYRVSFDSWEPEYEPPQFMITKTLRVLLVAFTPFSKPVYVLPDDCTIGGIPRKNKGYEWSDKEKAELREIMKDHPRSPNGRWVSY